MSDGCHPFMFFMNIVILFSSFGVTLLAGDDVPAFFDNEGNDNMWMSLASGLFLASIFGCCASCCDCLFCISMCISGIMFLWLIGYDCFYFNIFIKIHRGIDEVIHSIDTVYYNIIKDSAYTWKEIQDSFQCCGYNYVLSSRTGNTCPAPDLNDIIVDCRELLLNSTTTYCLSALVCSVVITLIVVGSMCISAKELLNDY